LKETAFLFAENERLIVIFRNKKHQYFTAVMLQYFNKKKMRKRIGKEDLSFERRENTRQRKDELNRELGREVAPRKTYGERPDYRGDGRQETGERKPYGERSERKPFDGERKPYAERSERKPFDAERKPYGERSERKPFDGERKPYGERSERKPFDAERKPYGERSERKPFDAERKPYGERSERKPFDAERKPYGERSERKPYSSDNRGERRDFNSGERKPFDGERKPYGERSERKPFDGERKPYGERSERKPYGERSERKPFDGERKPYGERSERKPFDGERKPYGERSERKPFDEERKPYGERSERKPYSSDNTGERRDFNSGERKPFDGERSERKPYGERSERKPFDGERKPYGEKKSYGDKLERRYEKKEKFTGTAKANFGGDKLYKAHRPMEESEKWTPNYKLDQYKESAPKSVQRKMVASEKKSAEVRLNRYIANAGICSRREADDLIKAGEIKVNGNVITEMGYQVQPGDIVKYGNRKLNREKMVYVLVNKPKDFITTTEDPEERKTVMDLVKNACEERIYPVGRLDRNTTGLLLLTNDGELADKLTHPSNEVEKLYQVEIDKPLTQEHFDQILKGVTLEDGEIKADELGIVTPDGMVVGIKIHSGRNRIVRRMFESLGYEVLKLDRTTFAGLTKKDLPRGSWRFLNEKEVVKLKFFK
jgi:23S rRNA pseudouridine2605 synthase